MTACGLLTKRLSDYILSNTMDDRGVCDLLCVFGEAVAQKVGRTCELLWNDLPMSLRAIDAIFCGHVTAGKAGDGMDGMTDQVSGRPRQSRPV